jgi:Transposase
LQKEGTTVNAGRLVALRPRAAVVIKPVSARSLSKTGIFAEKAGDFRRFPPQPRGASGKLLYRRRSLSHTLNHSLSHMTYGSPMSGPIVPPAREGHRRQFSEADKRRIVEEAARPGASLSEVARGYGIAARVLFRWKQELTQAEPLFVAVEIADATPPTEEHAS